MSSSSVLHRAVAWTMLGLYGLVASGLPLPVALPPAGTAAARKLAAKDRSQPFPCMDKPCGCDSAERCFTNCCCHTPAETLAWAKARGLEPAVIAALGRRVAAAAPAKVTDSCCAAPPAKPSCCTAAAPPKPACCAADEGDACGDDAICCDDQSAATVPGPALPPADEAPAAQVVTLRAMLACGGIVAQWAAACVSLPPPEIVTCPIPWPCIGTAMVRDEASFGTGGPPDLPPPRGC